MNDRSYGRNIWLAVLMGWTVAVTVAQARKNLIRNGDFEENPGMLRAEKWYSDGVYGFGTFADHAHSGLYAYKTWKQPAIWQDFDARPGQVWTVSAWFMNAPEGEEDKPLEGDTIGRIRIEFKNDEKITVAAAHSQVINAETRSGKWINLAATGIVPEGCTLVRVVINRVESAGSGVFYVDDVEVKR